MEKIYEELYKWVEKHNITRPKRNINRDFSDAVPLAEVLKHYYPKLVDLHNYSSRNSYTQKLGNWETLNNRVLRRLNINLTKKRMELLCSGEPGAIEKLLMELRKKIETKETNNENCEVFYIEGSNTNSPRNKSGKKMVPSSAYEKLRAELQEKSEAITILKSKVDHLECLLNIKEERIKDLTGQLQSIINQSSRPENPPVSKFFGFFQSNSGHTVATKNEEDS